MKIEHVDELKKEVEEAVKKMLGEKLKQVILYGSYARGDYDEESDIDFACIADIENEKVNEFTNALGKIVTDLSLKYDIVVSIVILSADIYSKYISHLPFYRNIVNEGKVFYGN